MTIRDDTLGRPAGLFLESWLACLETPVAVLRSTGEVVAASPAGREKLPALLDQLAQGLIASAPRRLEDFWTGSAPACLELEKALVRFTPLPHADGDGSAEDLLMPQDLLMIEWLPLTGSEELEMLKEVSEAVNSSLILEDIFEALGDVLHRYIPYREATIVILDATQNGIKILVRILADGSLEITGENNAFAGYDPVVDRLLHSPEAVFYSRDDLPDSVVFRPETAAVLVIPLVSKGVVFGLIAVASDSPGIFQPRHQNLLAGVSEQIAVAVENAKLYWQTQAQAGREFLINQLTKAIRQSLEIETILGTAVQELGKVTGISRCYIQYFPDGPGEAVGSRVYGYVLPGVSPLDAAQLLAAGIERKVYEVRQKSLEKTPPEQPLLQEVFNPFILNDVRDCPAFLNAGNFFTARDILSLAVFPIFLRDRLVGTITLHQCDAYRVWIQEDIELLKAIAEHLGVALHQARLFSELEQQKTALEETLIELQQAQIHLIQSEKMAMLGQFVAGIAHEVNTPLGTIAGNNETITRCLEKIREVAKGEGAAPADPKWLETADALLDINRMATDRIREIVRNLRNFARLDESELKFVNLHEDINTTLVLLNNPLSHSRITVEKRFLPNLPPVECFPGLLNQVFMNLLVNALHALEGRLDPKITIETAYLPETDTLRVAIADNGKGILEEHLPRIFDPGFTTKGVGVGTGLGLALCFKIVEKHRGRIEVQSTPDVGTTMTVVIPVRQQRLGL